MGIKTSAGGNTKWTNVDFSAKTGELTQSVRDNTSPSGWAKVPLPENAYLEGVITKIEQITRKLPDTGDEVTTVKVYLRDPVDKDDVTVFSFNPLSYPGAKFLGKMNAAAKDVPVFVRAGLVKAGTALGDKTMAKDSVWLSLSQAQAPGEKPSPLQPEYLNGMTELPATEKVVIGNKTFPDSSKLQEAAVELYLAVQAKYNGVAPQDSQEDSGVAMPSPSA